MKCCDFFCLQWHLKCKIKPAVNQPNPNVPLRIFLIVEISYNLILNMSWMEFKAYKHKKLKLSVYLLMISLCVSTLDISLISLPLWGLWRASHLLNSCLQLDSHFLVINSHKHPICPLFMLPFRQHSPPLWSAYKQRVWGFPVFSERITEPRKCRWKSKSSDISVILFSLLSRN